MPRSLSPLCIDAFFVYTYLSSLQVFLSISINWGLQWQSVQAAAQGPDIVYLKVVYATVILANTPAHLAHTTAILPNTPKIDAKTTARVFAPIFLLGLQMNSFCGNLTMGLKCYSRHATKLLSPKLILGCNENVLFLKLVAGPF